MTPKEQYDAFIQCCEATRGRTFSFNKNTSSLKNLIATLEDQLKTGAVTTFLNDGATVRSQLRRDSPKDHVKYNPALNELFRVWGTSLDFSAGPTPVVIVPNNHTVFDAIAGARAKLDAMKDYACSDAQRFWRCIRGAKKQDDDAVQAIVSKYTEYKKGAGRQGDPEAQASGIAGNPGPSGYSQGTLQRVHDFLTQGKSGCCTTFACAAAHILTRGHRQTGPRVEIVSVPQTHCFVIVGRTGGVDAQKVLPTWDHWGPDAVAVDAWLGSLGWEVIYTKLTTFGPRDWKGGRFEQWYDSSLADPSKTVASNANVMAQARLKKTGVQLK